ncbi:MAG: 50S ribosomal protein L1 [Candidatus Omnitrophota bacterium]
MVKLSKRMKEAEKLITEGTTAPLKEAVALLLKSPKVKFDETIELHFNLNIDVKNTDQNVRGTVVLPHGTGKTIRIAVICKGAPAQKAKELGADHVGAEELIEKISKGFLDFDCMIAAPDMMRELSKLGKILGPRGLMPSPKAGTVTLDVERAIKEVKAGKVEFKADKQAGIHIGIGKRSFAELKLTENANCVIEAITHMKPASVKGNFIKSLYLASTMGPGVRIAL